ncbi:uncharacterized protein ALTATR162_LOCUS11996 [Alternaria atra]|uniref:Azaphilone pigments biosynthesis cluster protein L N-terminal domain-containing protein n=1 Tax=Alternaria atra TaxID=119953 RepID=A0A8J2IDU6_9PLEO|nr:uncharacterized protein ALTATR162_LOCUS11996 [Alternaria atra]CAG5188619.1 unnamed protein product [Alternaria atra]
MADPFSITGSAVGVVSLAIQLCKGLEWYVSGVKDAKDKAEQIAAETEELANLLELLETIIGRVNQSQSVSATHTGIASCADAIVTIRKKLKPDDQTSSGGIKSSLKRLGKRMTFPFKEADIKYWKDALNTIQQSLQTALLALVIDQQRLASEDIRLCFTQLSLEQSTQHFSGLQLQRDNFDRTQLQLAGQSQILDTGFTATSHSLRSLHADVYKLQHSMQPIVSQTPYLGHLPRLQSTLERMVLTSFTHAVPTNRSQEAKLNEVCLTTDYTLETDVMSLRSLQRKGRRLNRRFAQVACTCQPQTSALGYQSKQLSLICTRTSNHDPQCPQSSIQGAVTDLQLRATLCSLILRTKVSLSLKLSYDAGFSVTQNLQCHRVVDESSPAFALVKNLVWFDNNMSDEIFRGEVDRLFAMFQHKQASPHDRLEDGSTLLHHLCFYVRLSSSFGNGNSLEATANLRYLFTVLLLHMSTEALETNDEGLTCVDELVMNVRPQHSDFYMNLLTTLLKHDLQVTRYGLLQIVSISAERSMAFAGFPFKSFVNPLLDDSELLEAIIMKSDNHIRHVLNQAQDPQALDPESVAYALAMATINGWIEGCKSMLEAGLMTCLDKDYRIFNPAILLRCSVGTNQLDMLQFWLSQREKHKSFQLGVIGSVEDMLDADDRNMNASYNMDEIRILVEYLSSSRHDIRLLAEEHGRALVDTDGQHLSLQPITKLLLDLTFWVDEAARSLELCHIIHEYIRLFVFSYLELRHICCDINRIEHDGDKDPDCTRQPYPRYSPREEQRIKNEDTHLHAVLEELVSQLISQYDSVGKSLQDFVVDVLLPKMRETATALKEEDKALYALGRRELGVIIHEDEAESEQGESSEEEEATDVEEESEEEY